MSESRQLAAIVFSDISGFTHTMETDENRAMEQIQKHIKIVTNVISEFNGEMLKEMGDGSDSYYLDWPLYKYYNAKGNTEKANKYLTSAYNHISKEEKNKFLSDTDRTKNIHKYYYIHEIIDTHHQTIR